MTNTARPAQITYLKDLLAKQARFNRDRSVAVWNELRDLEGKGELTAELVSKSIDAVNQAIRVQTRTEEGQRLLASAQALVARVEVPEGRYALQDPEDEASVSFYRVKRYSGGAVLVFAVASEEEHRLYKGARAVLQKIADAGIEESGLLYGRALGECGKCGRPLTDDASRARGIGPICASRQ